MTKWGDRPHWEYDAVLLGSDELGDWIGVPAGTHMQRPGAEFIAPVDQVCLVPAAGRDSDRGWFATFHASTGATWAGISIPVSVYVDITTPPTWDGSRISAVDLDLDVVRGTSGRIWIDDEDEFAEHRVAFGYPDAVARLAMDSCDRVHAALTAGTAPYDGSAAPWFDALAQRPRA